MKLHSPIFEKALRRDVRKAVRSSPQLKREFRKATKFRKQYSAALLVRAAISALVGFLAWQVADKTQHNFPALALINLWTFGFIFIHAQGLLVRLYASSDVLRDVGAIQSKINLCQI